MFHVKHMGWFLSYQAVSKYHVFYVKNMVLHPCPPVARIAGGGGPGRVP